MDIHERVARLERWNAWLMGVAFFALVACGLLCGLGQPQPAQANQNNQQNSLVADTIEARRFVVKDSKGTVRIEITRGDADNEPGLIRLFDAAGKDVASLMERDAGAYLSLRGSPNSQGIVLNGASRYLFLYGPPEAGNASVMLSARDASPFLEITNSQNKKLRAGP